MLINKISLSKLLSSDSIKPKGDIPHNLTCVICAKLLNDPKQGICGCRFCSSCIESYLSSNEYCPGNMTECKETKLALGENVYHDFATYRDVTKFIFKCSNKGCSYEVELKNMEEHIDTCPYAIVQCSLCYVNLIESSKAEHESSQCPERSVLCTYCNSNIVSKNMESEHLNAKSDNVCSEFVSICPFNCDKISRVKIVNHKSTCQNWPGQCPFYELGCTVNGVTKRCAPDHLVSDIYQHTLLLTKALKRSRESNEDLRENQEQLVKENSYLRTKLRRLDDSYSMVWRLDNFSTLIDQHKNGNVVTRLSSVQEMGKYGYRYQLELHLVNNNLGLFFCVARGEFDAALAWPLRAKISLYLMDQTDASASYKKNLRSEPLREQLSGNTTFSASTIQFFSRPFTTRNKGYGLTDFYKIDKLLQSDSSESAEVSEIKNRFIDNDTIFFKCIVTLEKLILWIFIN